MQTHQWATPEDARAADYLLGRLSSPFQSALEQAYLENEHQHDFIQCVELDLIEAYLEDSLGTEDRSAFVSHYLASPGNRRQLELVRALAGERGAVSRANPAAWAAAAAAGFALLAIAGWQYQENRSLRQDNAVLRARPPLPAPQPQTARMPRQATLFAGAVRQGGGEAVRIEPTELLVRFALVPDSAISPEASVRAILSGVSPKAIAVLPAQLDSEGRVVVDCPVGALSPGPYLWNIETGGKQSRTYSFRLEREQK